MIFNLSLVMSFAVFICGQIIRLFVEQQNHAYKIYRTRIETNYYELEPEKTKTHTENISQHTAYYT